MIKGYYIVAGEENDSGYWKKINDQIQALKAFSDVKSVSIPYKEGRTFRNLIHKLSYGTYGLDYDVVQLKINNPAYLYIRYAFIDNYFIAFLKKIKNDNPGVKIIVEIPTYPYDKEYNDSWAERRILEKDINYRKYLYKYVDKIVSYSRDEMIYGISTINLKNGIDVKRIPQSQSKGLENKIIRCIAVANFQKSHGYERIIYGLSEYCHGKSNAYEIMVRFVGTGEELNYYKQLVCELGLEDRVSFAGFKSGDELNAEFDNADIALGTFGFYKVGVEMSSNLKVREYLSRGIPFVSGCEEDVFDKNREDFFLQMSNDDSVVDCNEVVSWYLELLKEYGSVSSMRAKMREYALSNVDISITMKPVVDYLKSTLV